MWGSDDLSMADDNNGNRDESDSFRPMDMSFGFMEEDPQVMSTSSYCNGPGMESDVIDGSKPHNIPDLEHQNQILKSYISCACSISERTLRIETVKALEMARESCAPCVRKHDDEDLTCRGACLVNRMVMNHLRQAGYNAAICRSQFKYMAGAFPRGGDYEYMDVILRSTNSGRDIRLFVDLDFRTHFEIARPTREYSALLGLVPKIYVGRSDTLQSIIKIMCEGVKNSLKRKGMHLPPWRKYKYMHSMWLGSYKRTAACNSEHDDQVHGGYKSNIMITESPSVTELMGMGFKGINRHVWNPIHVEVAEEYLNWGSPAAVLLCKPSTGKFIRSTLSCALVDAGLTSCPLKNSRATTTMADYAPLKLIQ